MVLFNAHPNSSSTINSIQSKAFLLFINCIDQRNNFGQALCIHDNYVSMTTSTSMWTCSDMYKGMPT